MADSKRSIAQSALKFLSGTLISRLSGFFRDLSMAYAFGTGAQVAALLVAFRFAHLFRRLLGEGALQTAFIPLFEDLKGKSEAQAEQFFFDLKGTLACILLGLIFLASLPLFAAHLYFENEVWLLTLLCLPSLFFICLYGINTAKLQCERSFFWPSLSPVIFNLFWILGVFVAKHYPIIIAMRIVACFIVLGCLGQWAMTASVYRKFRLPKPFSASTRKILAPLALGVVGVGASQINSALDSVFALIADSKGPAYLWYAMRIYQLPLALFGLGLSASLLPALSRSERKKDPLTFKQLLRFGLILSSASMLLCTFILFFFSEEIVWLLFGRGDFTQSSILGTTACLQLYVVGLLPTALCSLFACAFYAKKQFHIPARCTFYGVLLNSALNALFVFGFSWNASSIALATSLSAWFQCFLLGSLLLSANGEGEGIHKSIPENPIQVID